MGLQPGGTEVCETNFCPHSAFEPKSYGIDAQETSLPLGDDLSHPCPTLN